jgi:uncharacterized membrane protein
MFLNLDNIKQFFIVLTVLLVIDGLWIGLYASKKWSELVQNLTKEPMKVKIHWAVLAYLCMGLAVYFFTLPLIKEKGIKIGALYGALIGFIIYGIFDYTNLAILGDRYTLSTALIDIVWGTFLMSISTVISYLIIK